MVRATAAMISACLSLSAAVAMAESGPRSSERFEVDAVTSDGFWVEIASHYREADVAGLDVSQLASTARLAYGSEIFEVGFTVPYLHLDIEEKGSGSSFETDGFGDISVYGKAVPIDQDFGRFGVGFLLTITTGDEEKALGVGEPSYFPFVTGAVDVGPAELRAHYGYRSYSGSGLTVPPSSHQFGFGGYAWLTPNIGVRTEVVAEKPTGARIDSQWGIVPGLDFRIPLGSADLLLRPSAFAGLTNETWDWGVGGSIALAAASTNGR